MTDELISCQRPKSIENVGGPLLAEAVSIPLEQAEEYHTYLEPSNVYGYLIRLNEISTSQALNGIRHIRN